MSIDMSVKLFRIDITMQDVSNAIILACNNFFYKEREVTISELDGSLDDLIRNEGIFDVSVDNFAGVRCTFDFLSSAASLSSEENETWEGLWCEVAVRRRTIESIILMMIVVSAISEFGDNRIVDGARLLRAGEFVNVSMINEITNRAKNMSCSDIEKEFSLSLGQ